MLQKVQVYSVRCTVADQQGGNCTHFDDEDQTRVTLCFLYKCTVYGAQWQTSKGGIVHILMMKTRQE